jgi:hypothetical protein
MAGLSPGHPPNVEASGLPFSFRGRERGSAEKPCKHLRAVRIQWKTWG